MTTEQITSSTQIKKKKKKDLIADPSDIRKVIGCYEQECIWKFRWNFLGGGEDMGVCITIENITCIIKTLTKKTPHLDGFTSKFCWTHTEEITISTQTILDNWKRKWSLT